MSLVVARVGLNFKLESAHEFFMNLNFIFLKSMNLNFVFSKSMNLNFVFSKSMNLNFIFFKVNEYEFKFEFRFVKVNEFEHLDQTFDEFGFLRLRTYQAKAAICKWFTSAHSANVP